MADSNAQQAAAAKGMPAGMEDALLGAPCEFFADGRRYLLHRPPLGVVILTRRIMQAAGIDSRALTVSPFEEALRLCGDAEKRPAVLELLTHFTLSGKDDHYNSRLITRTRKRLDAALSREEVAELLLLALSLDDYSAYLRETGMDEDLGARERAARAKRDGSTLFFGGKTLFGAVVDAACAKYGWTLDYCVWGVPYTTLRLLSCDAVTSVYMSDEEMKRYKGGSGGGLFNSRRKSGSGSGKMNFSEFLSALKGLRANGNIGNNKR